MDPELFAYRVTAIYLRDRLTREAMLDYAEELRSLRGELEIMSIPNGQAKVATLICIDGTLHDVEALTNS